jgi:hypothetical protein
VNEAFLNQQIVLETIRRNDYPHLPSRFTVFFAWQSLKDLERSRTQLDEQGIAWAVEGEAGFKSDMNLFWAHDQGWPMCAHAYWSQQPTDDPLFDYLLKLPVRVVERMAIYSANAPSWRISR